MFRRKPKMRSTHVSNIIDLSPHLRRIVVTGESLSDFPEGQEGAHLKVVLQKEGESSTKMRSYTIRSFDPKTNELALDFVVNRHEGPATNWAKNAKIGDPVGIAGPGQPKITDYSHSSYFLVGDITSINAINGFVPKFNNGADVRAIIVVPTRTDIIELDYDTTNNTQWFIEDESESTLEELVLSVAGLMAEDTHVFLGLEARSIRSLRSVLQDDIGFSKLNIKAVGYWKKGVNADKFALQKKLNP